MLLGLERRLLLLCRPIKETYTKKHLRGDEITSPRREQLIIAETGQTHQNILAQMIEFHAELANFAEGASLRPRLSASAADAK